MIRYNTSKKYFLLGLIFLILIFPISVNASGTALFSIESIEATVGETVTVPVKISGNPGFVSASLYVEFDDSVLTLMGVNDMTLIGGAAHTTRFTSPYILSWENDIRASNYTVNGTLAELVFTVSSFAEPGDYDIKVGTPTQGILNSNGVEVDCSFSAGTITVHEEECFHDWSDWKKSSSTRHKRSCDLCGEVEYDSHEWDDGEVTEEATEDTTGILTYSCGICGATKTKTIPALEPDNYNITGTVTSYGDADEAVTVILYDLDENVIDYDTTTNGTYTLSAPDGTYTLEVSKLNHVTREYEVTVDGEEVTQNVKICLMGDVNSDGSVSLKDYRRLLLHVSKSDLMTDPYAIQCADVNMDGTISLKDYRRLLLHVSGSDPLF